MRTTRNENGPAEAATSPSHGQTKTSEEMEMSRSDNITSAPLATSEFPIPYPSTDAADSVTEACAYLRIMREELARSADRVSGMNRDMACDMLSLVSLVMDSLETVRLFLDDNDDVSGAMIRYGHARRARILKSWEASL